MFFISNAYAQSAGANEPNPMITIAMFVGLFAFMYFSNTTPISHIYILLIISYKYVMYASYCAQSSTK